MKGFDENQMKELKNKRTMHRAGSEEHKWRLIYLILFPNTTLSEMPSPCKQLYSVLQCALRQDYELMTLETTSS
jgi:hypothetical protein